MKKVIVYFKKEVYKVIYIFSKSHDKKVIKSCKRYDHINILHEARDIHDGPRLKCLFKKE